MIAVSPGIFNGCTSHQAPAAPALPEAPCSMNVSMKVEGLGQVQVTGRGLTGLEAAQHLRDSVAAIQIPPPAPSREGRLAKLLTCGLTKATATQDWDLVQRLSKAAALVLSGAVAPSETPGIMTVRSQSAPETWYEVTADNFMCTCPDWGKHHRAGETKYVCKHGLSVAFWQRLEA